MACSVSGKDGTVLYHGHGLPPFHLYAPKAESVRAEWKVPGERLGVRWEFAPGDVAASRAHATRESTQDLQGDGKIKQAVIREVRVHLEAADRSMDSPGADWWSIQARPWNVVTELVNEADALLCAGEDSAGKLMEISLAHDTSDMVIAAAGLQTNGTPVDDQDPLLVCVAVQSISERGAMAPAFARSSPLVWPTPISRA